jgi:hypothetical protein
MIESTVEITDSLEALDEACDILKHEHDHPHYMEIAIGTLTTATALMREYSCDLFSDSEQIFVCDTVLTAIEALSSYDTPKPEHEENM